jgi:hypothetical protein
VSPNIDRSITSQSAISATNHISSEVTRAVLECDAIVTLSRTLVERSRELLAETDRPWPDFPGARRPDSTPTRVR